jgi:hypothetical protein
MSTVLGLLQSDGAAAGNLASTADKNLLIIYGAVAIVIIVVLGLRFLVSMFEVLTAPTASLKHHGEQNNFFQSLLIVILGGLIGTLVLFFKQSALVAAWTAYAENSAHTLAMANSNTNYRDIAEAYALSKLNANFSIYGLDMLVFLPMMLAVLWIVVGLLAFLFAKLFGGNTTLASFLGSLAFGSFFINIGIGLLGLFAINTVDALSRQGTPSFDAMSIIGAILFVYGLILWIIAVNVAPENTTGQTIGVLIFVAVLLAGTAVLLQIQVFEPTYTQFKTNVETLDMSKMDSVPQ